MKFKQINNQFKNAGPRRVFRNSILLVDDAAWKVSNRIAEKIEEKTGAKRTTIAAGGCILSGTINGTYSTLSGTTASIPMTMLGFALGIQMLFFKEILDTRDTYNNESIDSVKYSLDMIYRGVRLFDLFSIGFIMMDIFPTNRICEPDEKITYATSMALIAFSMYILSSSNNMWKKTKDTAKLLFSKLKEYFTNEPIKVPVPIEVKE